MSHTHPDHWSLKDTVTHRHIPSPSLAMQVEGGCERVYAEAVKGFCSCCGEFPLETEAPSSGCIGLDNAHTSGTRSVHNSGQDGLTRSGFHNSLGCGYWRAEIGITP